MSLIVALLLPVVLLSATLPAVAQPPLAYVKSIVLPGVTGRIDHMDADVEGQRLFVAALGNDSLEVVDIERERHIRHIAGFHSPPTFGADPTKQLAPHVLTFSKR